MQIRLAPYVTLTIDDALGARLRAAGERLGDWVGGGVRGHLLSAADDLDAAGTRLRDACDSAALRVEDTVSELVDRFGARVDPGSRSRDRDLL